MNRFLTTLLFALTVFVFASCQRDFSPLDNPVTPPVTDDSTLLVKYVQLDSVASGQFDTSFIMDYSYDNMKRMTALYASEPSTGSYYRSFGLYYNNTDTLPYKITGIESYSGTTVSQTFDTTFFTYNSSGLVETDSVTIKEIDSSGTTYRHGAKHYSYSSGKIIINKSGVYSKASFGIPETDSILITTQNGNIVTQSIFTYDSTTISIPSSNDFAGTFDNNPNPFYLIRGFSATSPYVEVDIDIIQVLQKNNCTRSFQSNGSGWQNLKTATYSYRSNGYPSVSYLVNSDTSTTGSILYSKGIYTYGHR